MRGCITTWWTILILMTKVSVISSVDTSSDKQQPGQQADQSATNDALLGCYSATPISQALFQSQMNLGSMSEDQCRNANSYVMVLYDSDTRNCYGGEKLECRLSELDRLGAACQSQDSGGRIKYQAYIKDKTLVEKLKASQQVTPDDFTSCSPKQLTLDKLMTSFNLNPSTLTIREKQNLARLLETVNNGQNENSDTFTNSLLDSLDDAIVSGNLSRTHISKYRSKKDGLTPDALQAVEILAALNGTKLKPGESHKTYKYSLTLRVEKVDVRNLSDRFVVYTASGYNSYCELEINKESKYSSYTGSPVVTGLEAITDVPILPTVFEQTEFFGMKNSTYKITSAVFAFSIYPRHQRLFKPSYKLVLAHNVPVLNSSVYTLQPSCVFWNYSLNARTGGAWSQSGCTVLDYNISYTTCICDHLTSFAVLMRYMPNELVPSYGLSTVTFLGVTVSVIALLLTLSIFIYLGDYCTERTIIHKNLCCSLIIAQVVFVSGINLTHDLWTCRVIAMLLHYFYLCGFLWMLCEGLHLYAKVIFVFNQKYNLIPAYYATGWGVPAIIVGISAAANISGYGGADACWLSVKTGHVWAFVCPVLAVCAVNLFILLRCIYVLVTSASTQPAVIHNRRSPSMSDRAWSGVKGTAILTPILGVTWLFGLLTATQYRLVFEYIFTVLNAFQGLFIFLFHCLGSSEVRLAVQRKRDRSATSKNLTVSPSSASESRSKVKKISDDGR